MKPAEGISPLMIYAVVVLALLLLPLAPKLARLIVKPEAPDKEPVEKMGLMVSYFILYFGIADIIGLWIKVNVSQDLQETHKTK